MRCTIFGEELAWVGVTLAMTADAAVMAGSSDLADQTANPCVLHS